MQGQCRQHKFRSRQPFNKAGGHEAGLRSRQPFNKAGGRGARRAADGPPTSPLPCPPANFRQKKHLGQHFLSDPSMLAYEAKRLRCRGAHVLEIGAGDGRLSEKILEQGPSSLTLVEIDRELARLLAGKFRGEKKVSVVEADILGCLGRLLQPKMTITGNIPYQISGPLFARLAELDFSRGLFCVQAEVALRLCASPGTHAWGRLSVSIQHKYGVKMALKVPPGSFSPPPKVDSAIIEILPKKKSQVMPLPQNFPQVVSALFSHRLQSVGNALFHSRHVFGMGKQEARALANTIIYSKSKVFLLGENQLAEIAQALMTGRM